MKPICPLTPICVAILLAAVLGAAVADTLGPTNFWGINPAEPASVQRGIDAAYNSGASSVVIPPGRYVIDQSDNPKALLGFSSMNNFDIEANDVTLVFPDRFKRAIVFDDCANVKLAGATITRGIMVTSQGTLVGVAPDRTSLDIRIHAGYPTNVADQRWFGDRAKVLTFYEPASRQILAGTYDVAYLNPLQLGPDLLRFPLSRPMPVSTPIAVGQYVAWRGTVLDDVLLSHCKHMRFEKIVLLGGTGFGIHESGGDGGNYYQYDVRYPPMPPGATVAPLLSTNADAFHSNGVRNGPTLENCHFEGMHDDGIPIHGAYSLVMESSGDSVVINLPSPSMEFRACDHLLFYGPDETRVAEATVVSIEKAKGYPHRFLETSKVFDERVGSPLNYRLIKLDHPVSLQFGDMVSDADACASGFVIRGCTVRNARARGLLIMASKGLIENCTIEGTTSGGMVFSPEMAQINDFNDADFSQDIVIRNNTIRRCGLYMQNGNWENSALTVAATHAKQFVAPPGHARFLIEHNTFVDNPGCNVLITSASDVTVKDNEFVSPMTAWNRKSGGVTSYGVDHSALINATLVNGLTFSGNTVVSPGSFMKTLEATGPGVVQTGMPGGIVVH